MGGRGVPKKRRREEIGAGKDPVLSKEDVFFNPLKGCKEHQQLSQFFFKKLSETDNIISVFEQKSVV